MMTLGGVPIRVVMPPRRDANARGMRKSDAGCLPLSGHPDRDRHEEADGAYVVHERREERRQTGERTYPKACVLGYARNPACDRVDYAGVLQRAAQHQNGGYGHHRRVAEALVGLGGGHDVHDYREDQQRLSRATTSYRHLAVTNRTSARMRTPKTIASSISRVRIPLKE